MSTRPSSATMRERQVENYLRDQAVRRNLLSYKFVSPENAGVPDRILIGVGRHGYSLTIFVEVKRPGEVPNDRQREVITTMRNHGAFVYVVDSIEEVDDLFAQTFDAPVIPAPPAPVPLPSTPSTARRTQYDPDTLLATALDETSTTERINH